MINKFIFNNITTQSIGCSGNHFGLILGIHVKNVLSAIYDLFPKNPITLAVWLICVYSWGFQPFQSPSLSLAYRLLFNVFHPFILGRLPVHETSRPPLLLHHQTCPTTPYARTILLLPDHSFHHFDPRVKPLWPMSQVQKQGIIHFKIYTLFEHMITITKDLRSLIGNTTSPHNLYQHHPISEYIQNCITYTNMETITASLRLLINLCMNIAEYSFQQTSPHISTDNDYAYEQYVCISSEPAQLTRHPLTSHSRHINCVSQSR